MACAHHVGLVAGGNDRHDLRPAAARHNALDRGFVLRTGLPEEAPGGQKVDPAGNRGEADDGRRAHRR